jgi:hypothetical protein
MRAAILPLLLLFAFPLPAVAAQTIVLHSKPLHSGIKIVQRESLSFALEVEVRSEGAVLGSFHGSRDEITVRTETILTWEDDHRRLKVTFDEVTRRERSQDATGQTQEEDPPSPLTGNTYIVDWTRAGGVTVGAVDDRSVPQGQADEVRTLYDDLGDRANEMADLLSGRRLVVGEDVDIPAETLSDLLGDAEDFTFEEFSMVLSEKRRILKKPCAVFVVEVVMTMEADGLRMLVRMSGEIALSIREGWLVSMDLRGPLAAEGQVSEQGLELQGGGSMVGMVTYAYGR